MESLDLTSRGLPERIFEEIVIEISGRILGGNLRVSSEELLKKLLEDLFDCSLKESVEKSSIICRRTIEGIFARMPPKGMPEGYFPNEFLVESVDKFLNYD